MRSPATLAVLTCAALITIAAPAAAQTSAPSEPTAEPIAHIFKFSKGSVTTTGPAPQPLIRVDQLGATTVSARLVMTPTTKAGKVKRSAKRISVPLGQLQANEVVAPTWPAARVLNKGYYKVKLNATTDTGAKLIRPVGAAGVTSLKVVKGKAVAASVPLAGVAGLMVQLAQAEVGQVEAPKGSNDSARIAVYRASTPGGPVGAWCAYFVSWLARSAGSPIGERGQGYGRVDDVFAWAKRNGKAIPAVGVPVLPGDFMVWDEHIGVVEAVSPTGTITTIDGNYKDAVTRRVLTPSQLGGVVGYVRL